MTDEATQTALDNQSAAMKAAKKKKPSKPKAKAKKPAAKKAAKPAPKSKAKKPPAKKAAKPKAKKSAAKRPVVRGDRLDFRLTKAEKAKVLAYAKRTRRTVTSVMQELIERMPK